MPNAPWYNDINVWEVATECRSCVNVTCEGGIKKNLDKEQTYPHMTMKLNWENKSMSNYFGSCRRKTPMKEYLSICVQYKIWGACFYHFWHMNKAIWYRREKYIKELSWSLFSKPHQCTRLGYLPLLRLKWL